eukprot:scaffold191833_cov24-Tisochrysis_lutea.AAC.1
MGSNRPSHAAIPKRKGISTESVVVQPAPTLKGTQHASIEDHHHDHQHDHSHLKKAEQEQILMRVYAHSLYGQRSAYAQIGVGWPT